MTDQIESHDHDASDYSQEGLLVFNENVDRARNTILQYHDSPQKSRGSSRPKNRETEN